MTTAAKKEYRAEVLIYFACSGREEAQQREKALRELASKLGFAVKSVIFDRTDKPPYALLRLADLAKRTGFRAAILTDYDWLSIEGFHSECLLAYLKQIGFRFFPRKKQTESDLLLHYIANAKNYCEAEGFDNDAMIDKHAVNRTGGRITYGYKLENDMIKPDAVKSRIVRSIFGYCARGFTPPQIVEIILRNYTQKNGVARSRIPEIILNDRYSGLEDIPSGYPVIVSPLLCFAAREKLKADLQYRTKEYEFLFKKLSDEENSAVVPGFRKANGREAVYCSPMNNRFISAAKFDSAAVKAIEEKLLPNLEPLKRKCIAFAEKYRETSEIEEGRNTELVEELKDKKFARYSKLRELPTRKELDGFDELCAEIMLSKIEINQHEHRLALIENARRNLEAYFDRLKKLSSISPREQRFFLERIVAKASVDWSYAELKLFGFGTVGFELE